jgi:hypothetical protein
MSDIGRVCAKIFSPEPAVPDERFVPLFHKWIRQRALGGLLLDVADYTHVPDGPGMLLVGHDTAFSLDRSDGRFGLMAQRRRPFAGDAADGVVATLEALFAAADSLERDMSEAKLLLDRTRIRIDANDRLHVPNSNGGFSAFQPIVAAAARRMFSDRELVVRRLVNDRRERLAVEIVIG